MNYEKKYKEALERAKSMIDDLRKGEDILAVSDLESMFPELKESEDERIRREIKQFIKHHNGWIKEWIDWLERQKTDEEAMRYIRENHSPSEVSDFQSAMNIAVEKAYNAGKQGALKAMGWKDEQFAKEKQELIDKACEWLKDNYPYYFETDIKEEFVKAMKGE